MAGAAERARARLLEGAKLHRRAAEALAEGVARAAEAIASRLAAGGTVYFFGNGGSAAQAQHLAAELTGRFERERDALRAVALGANASEVTSLANDYGYDEAFARPLRALLGRGDAAVGLSGSGGSANVARALTEARERGALAVAFTGSAHGEGGGPVGEAAEIALVVPATRIAQVQEIHLAFGHALCSLLEDALCPDTGSE